MDRATRALALLACVLLAAGCGRESKPSRNVLVVVIDTLRADRLGAYGNRRGLTPFLDGLARRGTLFEHAYAPSSWTMPSVASLFTSRYPTQHQVTTFASRLVEDEVTLTERLRDAGWIAGGFSANPNLRTEAGFGQGFDEFWASSTPDGDFPGDPLRERALTWLDRVRGRTPRAPVALFLQYMEPHEPYAPPEPFRSRFAVGDDGNPIDLVQELRDAITRAAPGPTVDEAGRPLDMATVLRRALPRMAETGETTRITRLQERLYDGDVAAADEQIRRLFEELERREFVSDDTLIVITADHGEEFLEHGGTRHGGTLYEETVRIPLILIGPGVEPGRRVRDRVSLIDLAPTVLDLLKLPPEARFEGRSLLPPLRGQDGAPELASGDVLLQLESMTGPGNDGRTHARAIIRSDDKWLARRDGGTEVYELATDPGETRNGAAGDDGTLRAALSSAEASLAKRAGPAASAPLDEATRARLRALGYMP